LSPISVANSRDPEIVHFAFPAQPDAGPITVDELDTGSLQGVLDRVQVELPERQNARLEVGHRGHGNDSSPGEIGLRNADEGAAPLGIGRVSSAKPYTRLVCVPIDELDTDRLEGLGGCR
jgi:hypothetical protein